MKKNDNQQSKNGFSSGIPSLKETSPLVDVACTKIKSGHSKGKMSCVQKLNSSQPPI